MTRFLRSRTDVCTHTPERVAAPRADACEGCGSTFNLRLCTECGYVGCCESQQGHDRSDALAAGHPVIERVDSQIVSFEEFARWYPDGLVVSREAANEEAKAKTGDGRQYGTNPYVGYDKPDTGPLAGFWTAAPF